MPQSPSAKKRVRQDEKRRIRNKSIKSEIKTRSRRLFEAVEAKDLETSKRLFQSVVSKIDKARKKKVIHRNRASRLESKLARLFHSIES